MTWGLALARATRPRRRVRGGAVMALGRHQPIGSTDALKAISPTPERRPTTARCVSPAAFAETVESELCYDI
jgi:hypothetical protein